MTTSQIFVMPDGNEFGFADAKRYDAIFEPLSKCSGADAKRITEELGKPHVAFHETTPNRSMLLDPSIRVSKRGRTGPPSRHTSKVAGPYLADWNTSDCEPLL